MTDKQIEIDKYKEKYGSMTRSELHEESVRISLRTMQVYPNTFQSKLKTDRRLLAIAELLKNKN